ncbi:acetyltransferase [Flavobacterium silvaticum]|uniref:Acetyltransferase n=1 Tax=Flavobacterium silvaticum TaxID=1852020 RepID=A0A972JJL7_9FLAO|nr:acetyltransferase [Flavobacterium silvaticum]NMH29518.1 acetyltransferase [Flavobacterium silvaticum]
MKTLAIIGAGHLGQQIAHYAISDKHYDSVVFFDDVTTEKMVSGYPVLGNTDTVSEAFSDGLFDEILIGIGYKHLDARKAVFEKFDGKVPFGKIIHSSVILDVDATVNPGCVIYPGCLIDAKAVISENTVLNVSCTIAHDTVIGNHCFLSPRVAIAGFVNVGERCVIGINATLIDNISIVEKTQIGAGTVVIKSIETAGLYVGNPHRLVR